MLNKVDFLEAVFGRLKKLDKKLQLGLLLWLPEMFWKKKGIMA